MLLTVYRKIVPLRLKLIISRIREKLYIESTRPLYKAIMKHYNGGGGTDEKVVIEYLKNRNHLEQYPYPFIDKYDYKKIKVHDDERLPYILHYDKKLYFPEKMKPIECAMTYNGILLEQDLECAHSYFSNSFYPKEGEIFVDVGCAEGLISLNIVQNSKHVYIFEQDEKWVEALNATFQPWINKVTITQKFVSDEDSNGQVTLDTFLETYLVDKKDEHLLLKIDVEGAEEKVLNGAKKLLNRQNTRFSICTYHKDEDEKKFYNILNENGFSTQFSNGYMIPFTLFEKDKTPPYLRRGLIRAWK